MIKSLMFSILLFSAVSSFANLNTVSDEELWTFCYRGPLANKIWMDGANTNFVNYMSSLGYDSMEIVGATYRICRDRGVKADFSNTRRVSINSRSSQEYIRRMRSSISSLTQSCPPRSNCSLLDLRLPLEGARNDNSVCGDNPTPTQWNGMSICQTGDSNKIWIDRPTVEFVNYLITQKWYSRLRALGIAYRVCRGADTAKNPNYASFVLDDIFRQCPAKGRCNARVSFPLEGAGNRTEAGASCR